MLKGDVQQGLESFVSDLELYKKFILLYRQERSDKKSILVDYIVKEETSLIKRIECIERLDEEYQYVESLEKKRYNASKENTKDFFEPFYLSLRKMQPEQYSWLISYIRYVFLERRKFIHSLAQTKIIQFRFFGLHKSISRSSILFFKSFSIDIENYLMLHVKYILEIKWKSLTPLEYNVLRSFYGMLERLTKSLIMLNNRWPISINVQILDQFIHIYIGFMMDEQHIELIKNQLSRFIRGSRYHPQLSKSYGLLFTLMSKEKGKLNLCNALLTFYSIYCHKVLLLNDLYHQKFKLKFNHTVYSFDKAVLPEVKSFIFKLENQISKVDEEFFRWQFLDLSLANYKVDLQNLWIELFYKFSVDKKQEKVMSNYDNQRFLAEREIVGQITSNITVVLFRATQQFLKSFSGLLTEYARLKSHNHVLNVRIFDVNIFIQELDLLKNFISSPMSEMQSISRERYFRALSQGIPKKEEAQFLLFEKWIGVYRTIALKLIVILLRHHKALNNLNFKRFLTNYRAATDPIPAEFNQMKLIPYAYEEVYLTFFYQNESLNLLEVLEKLVFYTINLSHFFRDKQIDELLKNFQCRLKEIDRHVRTKSYLQISQEKNVQY